MAEIIYDIKRTYAELDEYIAGLEPGTYNLEVDCNGVAANQFIGDFSPSPFGQKIKAAKENVFFNLKPINISENVDNANCMFFSCTGLTSIDTSGFTNITNTHSMFRGCSGLTSIDTSGFTNVDNANCMFFSCTGLTSIDTSGFTQVTIADNMFYGCSKLTSIDTKAFTKVTEADSMFYGCSGLTTIDTAAFTNVTNAGWMFSNCKGLTSIDTKAFTKVTYTNGMFYNCSKLTSIDTSGLTNVTNAQSMFRNCSGLTSITGIEAFTQVIYASDMFYGCSGLTTIDTSAFTQVTDAGSMFQFCSGLTSINWGNIKPSTNTAMFYGASAKKTIKIDVFDKETRSWIETNETAMALTNYEIIGGYDTIKYSNLNLLQELEAGNYTFDIDTIGAAASNFKGTSNKNSDFNSKLKAVKEGVYLNINLDIPASNISYMLYNNKNVKSIKINKFNPVTRARTSSAAITADNAFNGCTFKEIDLNAFANVDSASNMLDNNDNLEAIYDNSGTCLSKLNVTNPSLKAVYTTEKGKAKGGKFPEGTKFYERYDRLSYSKENYGINPDDNHILGNLVVDGSLSTGTTTINGTTTITGTTNINTDGSSDTTIGNNTGTGTTTINGTTTITGTTNINTDGSSDTTIGNNTGTGTTTINGATNLSSKTIDSLKNNLIDYSKDGRTITIVGEQELPKLPEGKRWRLVSEEKLMELEEIL